MERGVLYCGLSLGLNKESSLGKGLVLVLAASGKGSQQMSLAMAWLVASKNKCEEMEAKGAEWLVMASVIMSGSIRLAVLLISQHSLGLRWVSKYHSYLA